MLFHSPEFVLFLILILALYAPFPKARLLVLGAANLVFYGISGWGYLGLFVGLVALTYFCSLHMRGRWSRALLVLGVGANLANLVLFKYTGFVAATLGLGARVGGWVLPLGISFYTFHLVAYLVDVYRERIEPARSLLECWVFTAFFGQLIAGPIMRGEQFLPQIQAVAVRKTAWAERRYGIYLFVLGALKKAILADGLARLADPLFTDWRSLHGLDVWVAGWLFAFQIYYDFSAYSEMALGIGHLFGFDLAVNFETPYLAGNPAEFWRRWHISLSSWIRDYVYIPLGGSRQGEGRGYLNLLAAMALSGLWHGAAWTFVAWGVWHGLIAAVHRAWVRHVRLPDWCHGQVARWAGVALMFQATTLGWLSFRAPGLGAAAALMREALPPWRLTPLARQFLPLLVLLVALHALEFWLRRQERPLYAGWRRWVPAPVRALAYLSVAVLLMVLVGGGQQAAFIYFRF